MNETCRFVVDPDMAEELKNLAGFVHVHQYAGGVEPGVMAGEIGSWNGLRFVSRPRTLRDIARETRIVNAPRFAGRKEWLESLREHAERRRPT